MQDHHTKQYDERAMVLLLLIETLLTSISVWHVNCIFCAYIQIVVKFLMVHCLYLPSFVLFTIVIANAHY